MSAFLEYLLKSGVALSAFYLFYWIFLRKDTHFRLNRFILVGSLVLSLTLPLIPLRLNPVETVIPVFSINFDAEIIKDSGIANNTSPANWNLWTIFVWIYAAGALLVSLRLVYQAIYMQALSRLSRSEKHNDFTLVYMEKDIIPFSYFNKIFIPASHSNMDGIRTIIEHERSHLKQWHFLDLFLIEFITIIQWFNPVAWLYERSVKEIHEYLADRDVLNQGCNQGIYQALLVNQAMGGPVFTVANQFNQSLIKKRIVMMTKMKSPRWATLKAFLLLPIVALVFMAFAKNEHVTNPIISSISADDEQIVISGTVTNSKNESIPNAVIVIKATTSGTVTDIEGNYKIKAKKNDILVFSCVGYKTQIIPINQQQVINVQMELDAFTIDFNNKNALMPSKPAEKPSDGKATFVVVEEPPAYPGGTDALKKFIYSQLQYPAEARNKKIEGKVIVNFIVNPEGKITDAKVMRGTAPALDEEALRVTRLMTGWIPGKQNGKPVACRMVMPIEFKI